MEFGNWPTRLDTSTNTSLEKIQNSGRRNTPNSAGENKERDLKGFQNLEEVTNEPKLYKLLFLLELLLSELGNCSGKPGSIF